MFVVFWLLSKKKKRKTNEISKNRRASVKNKLSFKTKNLVDQCRTSNWLNHQNKWINSDVELRDREIHFIDEWSSNYFKLWENCCCFCQEFRFQLFCFQWYKTCTINRLNFASFLDFSWCSMIYVIFKCQRRQWTWRFEEERSRDLLIASSY